MDEKIIILSLLEQYWRMNPNLSISKLILKIGNNKLSNFSCLTNEDFAGLIREKQKDEGMLL